jgi:hypothetical protein
VDFRDLLWNPRMTHRLVRDKVFSGSELVLVDVGMRGGIQQHWTMLKDQLRVIGFEPDEAECRRLNSAQTEWNQVCFPVFLDSLPRERGGYQRAHNRAADGLHPNKGGGQRFGVPQDNNWAAAGRITQQNQNIHVKDLMKLNQAPSTTFVKTTTYEIVSDDNGLPTPDFMKVDVEGAEYDVLRGAERFLGPDGMFGLEVEVRIAPLMDAPSFTEVCQYLAGRGYHPYNMSLTRFSRNALPLEPDGYHTDHLDNPMLDGPTQRGQVISGDFVFFRDLIVDDVVSPLRILKCAAVLEIYNLPDCAAELLIYYRNLLSSHIDVDRHLAHLVPDVFKRPPLYSEYIDLYKRRFGRFSSRDLSDLATRRSYSRVNATLQPVLIDVARLAHHYLIGVPSLFYHRRIRERAHYFFVGIPSLFYRRKIKLILGYVELAARRSYGHTKVVLWHILIGIPRRAYQSISKRGGISDSAIKQAPHKPIG